MIDSGYAIEITGLTKRFGPTLALDSVSMRIRRGSSCALLGRNGAGKSTIIASLAGRIQPDAGEITIRGSAEGPTEGPGGHAIAVVYQKSTLVPELSAAENVYLGTYPLTSLGNVDWKTMRSASIVLLSEWGLGHVADRLVSALEPIERKIVEICRALARGPQILLLDEPTAGLDEAGCQELFDRIRKARDRGVTIIYVSHYLEEVFEVCDEAIVLRDGSIVMTAAIADLSIPQIVEAMVGEVDRRPGGNILDASNPVDPDAKVLLDIKELEVVGTLHPTSISARQGEIVGVSGLDGAGHVTLAKAVVGLITPTSGSVMANGTLVRASRVASAIGSGIGFVPEDRHQSGFVPGLSVEENATMTVLDRLANRFRLVDRQRRRASYSALADDWEIRAASPEQPTSELSGGNQQKVVMARALASDPEILVLINPTAGVDVTARVSIYRAIQELARRGRAVMIVSSDEVDFKIAHRVVVMFKGRQIAELHAGFTEHQLAAAVQGETR